MSFPATMSVDYVVRPERLTQRLYQPQGTPSSRLSCDPPDHPTAKYIQDHADLYYNNNYTRFINGSYSWPKNSLSSPGCL